MKYSNVFLLGFTILFSLTLFTATAENPVQSGHKIKGYSFSKIDKTVNLYKYNLASEAINDTTGTALMTDNYGYVYSGGQWYSQMLNGSPLRIVSSNYKIGIMTSSYGYAFNQNRWYSQKLNGDPLKIVGYGGQIGILTSSIGYVFNKDRWYSQVLNGNCLDMVANAETIAVMTNQFAYAFSKGQWYSQSLNGSPQKIVSRAGTILVFTSSYAYVFDTESNRWHTQVLSGTPIDHAQ